MVSAARVCSILSAPCVALDMDIHPSGKHVLVDSYDCRTVWFDTDLSESRPFRTLRYHSKAVRRVAYHPNSAVPLMATASDDGTVHVFHALVFNELDNNPNIVPVKTLKGHEVTAEDLGVLDASSMS